MAWENVSARLRLDPSSDSKKRPKRQYLWHNLLLLSLIGSGILLGVTLYLKRERVIGWMTSLSVFENEREETRSPLRIEDPAPPPAPPSSGRALKRASVRPSLAELKQTERYYVEWGMTLQSIAKQTYGRSDYWPYLYFYNESTVRSSYRLVPVEDIVYLPPRDYLKRVSLAHLYFLLYQKDRNSVIGRRYLRKAKTLDADLVSRMEQLSSLDALER